MKKAVLYARVSTDEQADRGYSLGVQQEQLKNYCESKGIEILKLYVEDHSAKNFDRPQFNNFLSYAKTNHRDIDYFYFVSWDRFSRNAPDAYEMLGRLKKWNIEPQAIMQPIDFSVPQNKIMLSIYLTLPEVDNDIRSEKIKSGIRGANKLGRWTSIAPIGYNNRRDERNKPIIVPNEQSKFITWGFEEVAKNNRPIDEIRRELNQKGVKVSKSNFSRLLRNVTYMGKMLVKGTEQEPEQLVDGVHESIITESLFYNVQLTMQNRNKKINKQHSFRDRDELPLRGVLCCSNCGSHVTGSASKSRNGSKHFYYHCLHCKKERFRADTANNEMEELLNTIQIIEEVETLYNAIVEQLEKGNPKQQAQTRSVLANELSKLEVRIEELQNTYIDGDLSAQEYTELKRKLESRILDVKAKITDKQEEKSNFKEQLKKHINILPNVVEWYRNGSVQEKKDLIGSIFPQRFIFKNNEVRTAEINPVVALILSYTKGFGKTKTGQNKYLSCLSRLVVPHGLEPWTT